MRIIRFLPFLLSIGLLTGLACSSSLNTEEELRSQITDLEEKLTKTQNQIDALENIAEQIESREMDETSKLEVSEVAEAENNVKSEEEPNDDDSSNPEDEILLGSFNWYENSSSVKALQEILEVTADGIYGLNTRATHLTKLIEEGLPTTGVPEEGAIPCPDPEPLPDTEMIGMSSLVADMDGDGNIESVRVEAGVGENEGLFYAIASGVDFGTRWVTFDFPEEEWRTDSVTDINNDGRDEFWVRLNPGGASVEHFSIIIFDNCEMRIARIPDSNDLWRSGGTAMSSWSLNCQFVQDGEGSQAYWLKQYRFWFDQDGVEQTSVLAYWFNGSGFTFVVAWEGEDAENSALNDEECVRWYQEHPRFPSS